MLPAFAKSGSTSVVKIGTKHSRQFFNRNSSGVKPAEFYNFLFGKFGTWRNVSSTQSTFSPKLTHLRFSFRCMFTALENFRKFALRLFRSWLTFMRLADPSFVFLAMRSAAQFGGNALNNRIGVVAPFHGTAGIQSDIEFWFKRLNEILFASQQRNRITEFKDAKDEGWFTVQNPCSLKMDIVMAVVAQHIKVMSLSAHQTNSRTNVARLIGRTVNLVNPAYSSLSWIWCKISHRLGFPFNLRAGRCFSTVAGVSDSDSIISLLRLAHSRLLRATSASLRPAGPLSSRRPEFEMTND
jgi:hypothetical protein